jgi:2-haloalkanoic acid dehalogenase type II
LKKYDAVAFDLLTALLDSWTLWESVAGSRDKAMSWRAAYLQSTYGAGAYRPYEALVAESAAQVGLPVALADELVARWDELTAWPGVTEGLRAMSAHYRLAIVTNCSERLAQRAAARAGVFSAIVSAERAGFYKPHERPYRLMLEELGTLPQRTLFVAGSPFDLLGATRVGMPVFWHNHVGLPCPADLPRPVAESRDFSALSELLSHDA